MHQHWRKLITIVVLLYSSSSVAQPSEIFKQPTYRFSPDQLILNPHLNPPRPRSQWRYLGYALAPLWIWASAFPSAMMMVHMSSTVIHGDPNEHSPPNLCIGYWNFGPRSKDYDSSAMSYCSMYNGAAVLPWYLTTISTVSPYNIAIGYAGGTNGNVIISTLIPTLTYLLFTQAIQVTSPDVDCRGREHCNWSYTLQLAPIVVASYMSAYLWELTHQPGRLMTSETIQPYFSPTNNGLSFGFVKHF